MRFLELSRQKIAIFTENIPFFTMNELKIDAEERALRAKEFFNQGYNCAQAVALAYADITGLDESTVATITASFGGGRRQTRRLYSTLPSSSASRTAI